MIKGIVEVPIYGVKINVYYGHDVRETLIKAIPDLPKEVVNMPGIANCLQLPDGEYHVIFGEKPTVNCIAHESFHLTYSILHNAGIDLSHQTEEAFAYLNGFIVEELYKHIFNK